MSEPILIVMPILGARDYTVAAIADCLAQSVPTRLLLVNQGVYPPFRRELEAIAEAHADRIFLWSHVPRLPSLATTWNRALDFAWEAGGEVALVVNNDVRLHRSTVECLDRVRAASGALFVSAVGVQRDDWIGNTIAEAGCYDPHYWSSAFHDGPEPSKGGPDFSCFLITRRCHAEFRFDEAFIPAYCEDLDYHRRLLLAGRGADIFSVNLPYLHYAAGTLKSATDDARAAIERAIGQGSRAHYERKWGGPVNAERFLQPFDEGSAVDDGTATTPWLQAHPPGLVEVEDEDHARFQP